MRLTQAKLKILSSTRRFRYLNKYQITALHYAPSAETTVERHCHELLREGYLRFEGLETGGPNPLRFYTLTPKGAGALRRAELFQGEFRPATKAELTERSLPHIRAANDALIQVLRLAKVSQFRTEYELRQRPIGGIVPDGLVAYEVGDAQKSVHLEVDLTNTTQQIQDKVRRLLPYARSSDTTVLYLATDEARLKNLKVWVWQQLQHMGAQDDHSLFCFAVLGAGDDELKRVLHLSQ